MKLSANNHRQIYAFQASLSANSILAAQKAFEHLSTTMFDEGFLSCSLEAYLDINRPVMSNLRPIFIIINEVYG